MNESTQANGRRPGVISDSVSPKELSVNKSVRKRDRTSGGRVEIEQDLCKGCYLCTEACPPQVLKISNDLNKMGYHPVEYLGEGCTGCGVCFYVCPEPGAIRVYKRVKRSAQISEAAET